MILFKSVLSLENKLLIILNYYGLSFHFRNFQKQNMHYLARYKCLLDLYLILSKFHVNILFWVYNAFM